MNEFDKQLSDAEKDLGKKSVHAEYSDKYFYDMFSIDMAYAEGGEKPYKTAGEDLKALLRYRNEKLEKMELRSACRYAKIPFAELTGNGRDNGRFKTKQLRRLHKRHFVLKNKKGKHIRNNRNVRLVQQTVYVDHQKIDRDERFCCPECGEAHSVNQLEEGCPGCGKSFYIIDIFPKVSSCFAEKASRISLADVGKIAAAWFLLGFFIGIPWGIVRMVKEMPSSFDINNIFAPVTVAFYTPFEAGFIGLLGAAATILAVIAYESVISIPTDEISRAIKKRLVPFMLKADKNFSYEHFESKVIYLVQLMLFCDDAAGLGVCRCKRPPYTGDSIVDSVYTGIMNLVNIDMINNVCRVTLEVTMEDTYCSGDKFSVKNDKFLIRLERSIYARTDYERELSDTKCPWCEKYFDALKNKTCPHCSEEYNIRRYDWTVCEFKLL